MDGIFKQFEGMFAGFIGSEYAVACNSGTSALTLALAALGVENDDEVIVPEFSMISAAWAVAHNGAEPVFVDCGDDLNIDVDLIEKAITEKTKAIIPVHIYGRPCNMKEICKIADKHKLKVVEDVCEACGAICDGMMLGKWGDIGCFSFYHNKIVAGEEGGMCTTDDKELKKRMDWLKSMAFSNNIDEKYTHDEMAFNFRMPDSQALLAMKSLDDIVKNIKKRKQIESWYNRYLKKELQMPKREVVWVYDIRVEPSDRKILLELLNDEDIAARPFFTPMSKQPLYLDEYHYLNANKWFQKGIYLPVNISMTKYDVKHICKMINHYYEAKRHF